MDAMTGIGGAGTSGDKTDARLAGKLAIGFRHHGRTTLIAADEHINLRIVQGVEHRQVAFSRDAGEPLCLLDQQLIDQDAATASLCHFILPAGFALSFCLRMMFSENRYPLFPIMR